jgi:hypothetical protein
MQLNESTYETIFLLYIDNELNPKEKLEVEAFIADNPSYALEMEALQATVLRSEQLQYPFKENLKQQLDATSLEELEKDWNQTYATILKDDVEAIPGLSTSFKNALKKDATKGGIVLKPLGFSQQKFTYAAVAACLMVFLGYQQLTKTEMLPNAVSPLVENKISNASPKVFEEKIETIAATKQIVLTKQQAITELQASNPSKRQRISQLQKASIAIAESIPNNTSVNNQAIIKEIPRTYNNPTAINATPIASISIDDEAAIDENLPVNYEVIDTEDPDRTIFIANFEIDGNKLRGLKRKVTSLFKNNKSERNQ